MIKIPEAFKKNNFIENVHSTKFIKLLQRASIEKIIPAQLKKSTYIHGLLKYPTEWKTQTDIFKHIYPAYLNDLQSKKSFFVFDCSDEGYSPLIDIPFFDILYYNCKKYNVSPSQIIYVSSNLKDEENIDLYCRINHKEKINVVSFLFFEFFKDIRFDENKIEALLTNEKQLCEINFTSKYFSSLNRRKRKYRAISTFLLCQESISERCLISHDVINNHDADTWLNNYNHNDVAKWRSKLPLTIDQKDFNHGHRWVDSVPYAHIHHQTIFQLVNETDVETKDNTALFYTEKTFKPINHFQPFIIYGQPGINHYLENFGYRLYNSWFDLEFDYEEDHVIRFKKIIKSLNDVCKLLDSLSRKEKINWRFNHCETLMHNYRTMKLGNFNQQKMQNLLDKISTV
jgi:hypothetical protein